MLVIVGLLLLAAFILWGMSWRDGDKRIGWGAFGCLLVAVALIAFGERIDL